MSESTRRPVILVVDDEPAVLAAVARDLRRGFGERYRVVRAGSGECGERGGASSRVERCRLAVDRRRGARADWILQ